MRNLSEKRLKRRIWEDGVNRPLSEIVLISLLLLYVKFQLLGKYYVRTMDKLSQLNVNPEVPKSEFIYRLSQLNGQAVSSLRLSLFNEARCLDVLEDGDEPVTRRKSHHGKSV